MSTDADGQTHIETSSIVPNDDVRYDITVRNVNGQPLGGVEVSYGEINRHSIIYFYDPSERYAPALLYGTPDDIAEAFRYSGLVSISPRESEDLITVSVLITMALLTTAQVDFLLDAYEIQSFLLTDGVEVGEDYVGLCKTWTELAEFINARVSAVLNLTSIVLAYSTFGSSSSPTAWGHAASGIASASISQLRQHLLEQAVAAWGVSMSEISGSHVFVKVYPVDKGEFASGVRNLWAQFEIERGNPACESDDGPVGRLLVDVAGLSEGIHVYSDDGLEALVTNDHPQLENRSLRSGRWSPSGDRVVFVADENYPPNYQSDVFVYSISSGDLVNITNTASANEVYPTWDRTGSEILYVLAFVGGWSWGDIVRRDLANGGETLITSDGRNMYPEVAPDNARVLYSKAITESEFGIYSATLHGASEQLIIAPGTQLQSPRWAPNGQQVSYLTYDAGDGQWGVYLVNAVGTGDRLLVSALVPPWSTAWSPDGSWVYYDTGSEIRAASVESDVDERITSSAATLMDALW